MSRVALVYGFWGQNIGNAFFNVGGEWLLRNALGPEDHLHLVQDQPGYRTFHNQAKGNPVNDVGLLEHIDVDAVVLQGPMLTRTFRALWEPAFRRYRDRGTKVILLGAALFKFDQEEIDAASAFLREYPPAVFVSRDHDSYEVVEALGLPTALHDGIDSAFFTPLAVDPVPIDLRPYVTFTFDRYAEPTLVPSTGGPPPAGSRHLSFDGYEVDLVQPGLQAATSKRGKWQAYLGHVLDRRTLPDTQFGRTVIRAEHRFNPHITPKIYQHPNAIASDEPYTYLSLYAQTDLTLSDRVHACVATLAFGSPAMLFSPSPRARLFDRVGLGDIREGPRVLDPTWLAAEQAAEIEFLDGALAEVGLGARA